MKVDAPPLEERSTRLFFARCRCQSSRNQFGGLQRQCGRIQMYSRGLGDNYLGGVRFERQPPEDLRKSNFFSFEVSLEDLNREQILIEEAHFIDFVNGPEELKLKNGIKYGGTFRYANGMRQPDSFVVRLVDSASGQPVPYEGQDGDPKMQMVLLTHEVTCARCSQKKSCGNKNETPSDPVICNK
ncbi:transcription factor coe2-A-like [Stegodyphus dumicola]|uniref:transcription factor coe2-A-like n=1 Tax=Stegodyphus dumicola TaxID=202533 RepID=UPI0015AF22B9|nr:transcription factor coe2-A-like [Stegodyphus dumicola]